MEQDDDHDPATNGGLGHAGRQCQIRRAAHRGRLPYVEQGDPAGVPVVLLHGGTDSWRSFEPVLPYLPGSIHAFALTLRGHGDASRPAAGYRPRDFAADVAAFLDSQGLESASSPAIRWGAPSPCASRSTTRAHPRSRPDGRVRPLPDQPGHLGVLGDRRFGVGRPH